MLEQPWTSTGDAAGNDPANESSMKKMFWALDMLSHSSSEFIHSLADIQRRENAGETIAGNDPAWNVVASNLQETSTENPADGAKQCLSVLGHLHNDSAIYNETWQMFNENIHKMESLGQHYDAAQMLSKAFAPDNAFASDVPTPSDVNRKIFELVQKYTDSGEAPSGNSEDFSRVLSQRVQDLDREIKSNPSFGFDKAVLFDEAHPVPKEIRQNLVNQYFDELDTLSQKDMPSVIQSLGALLADRKFQGSADEYRAWNSLGDYIQLSREPGHDSGEMTINIVVALNKIRSSLSPDDRERLHLTENLASQAGIYFEREQPQVTQPFATNGNDGNEILAPLPTPSRRDATAPAAARGAK